MSFWVLYDHIGKLMAVNLFCAAVFLPAMLIVQNVVANENMKATMLIAGPLLFAMLCVVLPMQQAGLTYMVRELIEKHDGSVKTFFVGVRKFGFRAVILGGLCGFISCCLLCSAWYYVAHLSGHWYWLGYGLSAASCWCMLFLLLCALIILPALIYMDRGILPTLKIAAALTLDNLRLLAGALFLTMCLLVLMLLPPVYFLFSFAPAAVLQCSLYEILSRRYAAIRVGKECGRIFSNRSTIDFGDNDDEYLCRGIRDALFPWKE